MTSWGKEAGCTTELDYTEQTSWLLFLKYLDDLEGDRATAAELAGRVYDYILDAQYEWDSWAAPKGPDGTLDHQRALTGDDLVDFVERKLFPYLHGFKRRASGPNTIEYKIGEIKNKVRSGYNLREVIDQIDGLRFRSQVEKHELSALYEEKIKRMGNAGRNSGEYYTPRPLIRAMVQVVAPRLGERVYDGACASAGFLCEAHDYLAARPGLSTADLKTLQERTFYGKERKEVQQNFPIRTGETAFLFLQHFIKTLKADGRGGVVIKNTFLSNSDSASVSLRKLLLESCNLRTVLDCPGGTFQGAGVKTVVLPNNSAS